MTKDSQNTRDSRCCSLLCNESDDTGDLFVNHQKLNYRVLVSTQMLHVLKMINDQFQVHVTLSYSVTSHMRKWEKKFFLAGIHLEYNAFNLLYHLDTLFANVL